MISLAIETSCDETSVAVLNNDRVISNIISSQISHTKFGGVVPEIASREHLGKITEITDLALNEAGKKITDIELISATSEPGLIGALLTGLNFGKSLSMCLGIPFVPVNHIHAHLYSNFIGENNIKFPFISLIVSGGHTMLVLAEDFFKHTVIGKTVDDAAGEAFDKVAKLLGLNYPGGPEIEKYSANGNTDFHDFPLAHVRGSEFDFSFSGIKTSVLYFLRKIDFENIKSEKMINDICASFQKAAVNSLFNKTLSAAEKFNANIIMISGGVSSNKYLQNKFNSLKDSGYSVSFPEKKYSTDNAAMIGLVGFYRYKFSDDKNFFLNDSLLTNAKARLNYEEF
ncbi:MAG: tRNA (adenosine(37)-N6)-threonylcarbamoyltransferase complex transferase subunit TsaD [Bacteroidetes bacterium]|nr:tRNA (adenosine(37)-N6)-threonylcarbamoyltransferase complex transferase subunit TsaD [Bacteroidota bacterium]